jgi:hypothetical protein
MTGRPRKAIAINISLIRRAVKLGLHVGEHSHRGIKLSIARPGVRPLQPIHLF